MESQPYVMTPAEIVWGVPLGYLGTLPGPIRQGSPRQVLESVVLEALQRPPCGVAFSGGRDSSALLAIAAHVARREALPAPVAITKVFPGIAATDEEAWQEQVISHVGVEDWVRIPLGDELDLVGPLATVGLRRFGVVWPPAVHGDQPLLGAVGGGSLLDGEGGDEVLGVERHRIDPFEALVRSPRPLRRRRVIRALDAVAPRPVRRIAARRRWASTPVTWLRPDARRAFADVMIRHELAQPLSFAASVRRMPQRRSQLLGDRTRRAFAREHDVELSSPLLHPDVVHALAREGGWLGRGDRTAVLRGLVPDLLPDEILTRRSKADFGGVYFGGHTRAFARTWSGAGVDADQVDADELRRLWASGEAIPPVAALLQSAWLADHAAGPSA